MVEGIFLREARQRIPPNPVHGLRRVGLDEIAERKGRKADDLIVYNLDTGQPVDGLEGRTKEHLIADLKGLSEEVKRGIAAVCIDRWRPYAQAVAVVVSHAEVVVDRFHGMQSINRDLKALKNARKKDLPEEAKACHDPLLKKHDDLTEKQRAILAAVYKADAVLKRAHQLKEQFRVIFETVQTVADARKQVQKWIGKAYKCEVLSTGITERKSWLRPILKYFTHRTTHGRSEGMNNKIKLIKRRAYGFRNFGNFRLRILTAFL